MRILHISADYPDPLIPAKTRAVSNLLAMVGEHEHKVFSLNRIQWRSGIESLDFIDACGENHLAVAYGAPPKGLFMKRFLMKLAAWIEKQCEAEGFRPDVIHAHKLSVEGLVGDCLAKAWKKPLLISSQGNSDLKIIGSKRDLRQDYARIWREAEVIFPFAPWAGKALGEVLGERNGPVTPLPCPGPADERLAPKQSDPVIRTAFHFNGWKNKNAERLIRAIGRAAKEIPDIRLEIIGGGDPEGFAKLAATARAEAPGRVTFPGAVPNDRIQALFNESCAFAMVSHRESYGMVFAEALLAGTPCLFSRGRAIDGYFEEGGVVLAADPSNEDEITAAIIRLVKEQDDFKSRLDELGAAGGLDFMRAPAIKTIYMNALANIEVNR